MKDYQERLRRKEVKLRLEASHLQEASKLVNKRIRELLLAANMLRRERLLLRKENDHV